MAFTVLIVDDSETIRGVISKTLSLAGVPVNEVHQAANGAQALEQMRQHWVDLVFTDINMPEMSGVDMIDAMKADPALQSIPIVVISTDGSEARMTQLRERGVQGYLRKPFTPEQLREVMTRLMGEFPDANA